MALLILLFSSARGASIGGKAVANEPGECFYGINVAGVAVVATFSNISTSGRLRHYQLCLNSNQFLVLLLQF